jgi:N-acetylmuramic acid 6-phosphate etherase
MSITNELEQALTEQVNQESLTLDQMSSLEIVALMNRQDLGVVAAVQAALEPLAKLVDASVERMQGGGRLFYIGAGTSGRLGMLDAAECPPTFGTPPELVQAILAGGPQAFLRAVEHAEDDVEKGAETLRECNFSSQDVLVGISASGRTPFVIGALRYARQVGAATGSIFCNPGSALSKEAELPVLLEVGPEVLSGSTRLKAGTATKMALNMLSTAVMVRLGKTFGNLMVDLTPTCEKLVHRSIGILAKSTQLSRDEAQALLESADGDLRVATVAGLAKVSVQQARQALDGAASVREAISNAALLAGKEV